MSHRQINPFSITPVSPVSDILAPDRGISKLYQVRKVPKAVINFENIARSLHEAVRDIGLLSRLSPLKSWFAFRRGIKLSYGKLTRKL